MSNILHLYRLFAQAEELEHRLLRLGVRAGVPEQPRLRKLYERANARRQRRRAAYDLAVYGPALGQEE